MAKAAMDGSKLPELQQLHASKLLEALLMLNNVSLCMDLDEGAEASLS